MLENTKQPNSCKRFASTLSVVVVAVGISYATYELHRSIDDYGWKGTLRYIWEGDPYETKLRTFVQELEESEFDLIVFRIDDRLQALEQTLNLVTSSSADETLFEWNQLWIRHPVNSRKTDINNSLADLSDRLDTIASRVDGIIFSSIAWNDNYLTKKIKKRKRIISKDIATSMGRCDALLTSIQLLNEIKGSKL